jgi:hypothetical protein
VHRFVLARTGVVQTIDRGFKDAMDSLTETGMEGALSVHGIREDQ